MTQYVIGLDYGTESGRAVLVDVATGREVATAVHAYASGVIDAHLPGSSKPLPPEWALQDPRDYVEVLKQTVPAVLTQAGILPEQVIGLGVDFTACTILPTLADGTPLCAVPQWADHPHAWVKLWKHHAAQPQADQINALAQQRGEAWLARYGGKISSEWFFSKVLQVVQEAPAVYDAAATFIEAGDWIVWQMTGQPVRNTCAAGYKGMVQDGEFPSREFFAALDPRLADVVDTKLSRDFAAIGASAGGLTAQAAAWMGLLPGTPVAVPLIDAHVFVPAVGVTRPGSLVMIMGTSTCHMILGDEMQLVEGISGVVKDGILPGYYGYEAGQAGVGDIFAWFVNHAVPDEYAAAARAAGMDLHQYLEQEAARQQPGEHGLIALDWINGNRSVLVDADLSGLIVGLTLGTRAPDIYRALIEATAFGTRLIIEAFEAQGVPVHELVAAGGLPEKNQLLMQIYADVTGRAFKLAGSSQAGALGSAMWAAVAAGAYPNIEAAAVTMAKVKDAIVQPNPAHRATYDALYADYKLLHDTFGRGVNDVMKRLKRLRHAAKA